MKRKVIFRADGNFKIGYGHFIRTIGIANLINKDFYCVFATQEPTEYQSAEIKKVCKELVILNNTNKHFDEFINYLNGDEIVVLDNYYFNSAYQQKIRKKGCKLIYIDDLNKKKFVCDVLINNIPGYTINSFKKEPYTRLCLGTDYALLRKEFFNPKWRKVKKQKGNIFLSFGGSDRYNITGKIVKYLLEFDPTITINILVGDAFKHYNKLVGHNNLKLYKNIAAEKVAELMSISNLCIITASSLLNEAASIGSNIMVGYCSNNQIQPYKYFVNNKLAIGVEDYRKLNFVFFKKKLLETIDADFLIENQRMQYRNQQGGNLKEIFKTIIQ